MKTTQKHFELFKSECQRWEKELHLEGWDILHLHKDIGEALADASINIEGMTVATRLNTDWKDEPLNDEAIKNSAKHEMMHILIARPLSIGKYRWVTEIEMKEAEEDLVHKLMKLIK